MSKDSRYDDPDFKAQVSMQMLATPTHEIACRCIVDLRRQMADHEEVHADKRRLVRELDVLMNGDNAATQASLCDIVGQFPDWLRKVRCAAVCHYCAGDTPMDPGDPKGGHAIYHATGVTYARCRAADIRRGQR